MADLHSDFTLVDRYLSDDKVAGEELFGKTYSSVKAFVYKQTSQSILTSNDKDDIILEALKIAIEKLSVYDGTSSFSTYVIGIAKNLIKKQYTKKGFEDSNIFDISDFIDIDMGSLTGRNPETIVIKQEDKKIIASAISTLSSEHQQVLLLRAANGMKFKDIGNVSGVGEDAARKMFGRAVLNFSENLKKFGF